MKSDYRFRDLDAQPISRPTYECSNEAIAKFPDERNPFTPFARLEFDEKNQNNSDVVPSPENVSQVTPDMRNDIIDDLTECLKAAISYIEDDSHSERRRQACLDSFRAALNAAEKESNK